MQNISIGRYKPERAFYCLDLDTDGNEIGRTKVHGWAGWIEGVRADGSTWIMYLDDQGNPDYYWAHRDSGGGVIGDPVLLSPTCLQRSDPTEGQTKT
ncbi:hypothetical protein [Nocardia sp. NBC_01327]|uniref:hypothetical protein n=1 Tax=Nocardia sp. NBC_01327 TaxID=2903593 RepID=UPI002E0F29FD|nr:hypothetical protein OG326_23665 [Nocardia sp. NBC_01327]